MAEQPLIGMNDRLSAGVAAGGHGSFMLVGNFCSDWIRKRLSGS
jgi:hypothetical protein